VRNSTRSGNCYVVFEAINDARYLPLIKALLSRNFTIFGGTEAYNCEDALNKLRKLTIPGWDAETGQYTSEQSSSMALTALRNIDKFFGGIKVVDLQMNIGKTWPHLQSDDLYIEVSSELEHYNYAPNLA
jgi:hypothetical protein